MDKEGVLESQGERGGEVAVILYQVGTSFPPSLLPSSPFYPPPHSPLLPHGLSPTSVSAVSPPFVWPAFPQSMTGVPATSDCIFAASLPGCQAPPHRTAPATLTPSASATVATVPRYRPSIRVAPAARPIHSATVSPLSHRLLLQFFNPHLSPSRRRLKT